MTTHAFTCDGAEYEARVRADGNTAEPVWLADLWKDGAFTGVTIPLGVDFDIADAELRAERFAGCEGIVETWSRKGLI